MVAFITVAVLEQSTITVTKTQAEALADVPQFLDVGGLSDLVDM